MATAVIFTLCIMGLYILLCIVTSALCATTRCKKETEYCSVSNEDGFMRFINYIENNPEKAIKIICINNLTDSELSEQLIKKSGQFGFKVI